MKHPVLEEMNLRLNVNDMALDLDIKVNSKTRLHEIGLYLEKYLKIPEISSRVKFHLPGLINRPPLDASKTMRQIEMWHGKFTSLTVDISSISLLTPQTFYAPSSSLPPYLLRRPPPLEYSMIGNNLEVANGLSLIVQCRYRKCVENNVLNCISVGIGLFAIWRVFLERACPVCSRQCQILGVALKNCRFMIKNIGARHQGKLQPGIRFREPGIQIGKIWEVGPLCQLSILDGTLWERDDIEVTLKVWEVLRK